MSRLFSHNAYSVLGLDTSASQKEISRRSKEIQHKLWADENPEYETDIDTLNKIVRDESSVNDAVQRLSSPVKRISEYFFWFEIENEADEKNLSLLRDNQYDEALENWKERAEKSLTAKRNLAIASSLLLNNTGYKKYLKLSVDAWKDVVNSDRFWQHFEKVYALNDEVGTSKAALDNFRSSVTNYLSDFYTDVSQTKKDNSIYAAFGANFGARGQKVQDEVLAPIFERIDDAAKQLHGLNVSEDGIISSQEVMTIKRLAERIRDSFQEVKDLGLFDDSRSKVMRDKAAEAINIVAVDLFNNLNETTKSSALAKLAKTFASGPAVISQINKNIETMRQVAGQGRIIQPINDLIEKEKYSKALELINEEQEKHKKDATLQEYFRKRIQWCVTALANKDFTEAKRLFEAEDFANAASWFSSVYDFIYSYVDNFDIEKGSLEGVLESLRAKLINVSAGNLKDIDDYRQKVIENSDAGIKDEEKFELPILIMLLDSAIYQRLSELIPVIKKQNQTQRIKKVVWNIIIWGAIIGFIAMSNSSSSNSSNSSSTSSSGSSSSNSAWQTCSNEYDNLKSQLDSINSTMDSYKSAGNTTAFNNLVPQQNSLVQQLNSKASECNNLR